MRARDVEKPALGTFTAAEQRVIRRLKDPTAVQHFLNELPATLSSAQLVDLDTTFHLSSRGNSEVLFAWLRIAIGHAYRPAMPAIERFLTSQGRRKFLRPLYEDLMATDWGAAEARRIYAIARPTYHAVAVNTLDQIVNAGAEAPAHE